MRDVALIIFFAAMVVATLRRPFYGALLWVLFGLMNPHRLTYDFAYELPFAQATAVVTLVAMGLHFRQVRWPAGAPIVLMVVLFAWMTVTSTYSIVPEPTWVKYIDVAKIYGMTLVVAMLIRTREQIVALVVVIVFAMGFFGFKGGIFTIATGGNFRVWGPPSSLVEGNNELAVALIICIPLMYFLVMHPKVARDFWPLSKVPERWLKRFVALSMLLCTASAIGSHSRGALLALIAMGSVLWWRSRSKITLAAIAAVAGLIALPMLPDAWFERMESIRSYEEDLSSLQRLNSWQTAINIANDRTTGAGFTTAHPLVFDRYSPRPGREWIFVAHSIYFQVLGDHGYVGLALYLLLWLVTYLSAGRTARQARASPELDWAVTLMNMCKVSVIGFAVGGAFLSLAYWDLPYYLIVLVVVTRLLVRQHLAVSPVADVAVADPVPRTT